MNRVRAWMKTARARSAYLRTVLGWRAWVRPPSDSRALFDFTARNFGILQFEDEILSFEAFLRTRSPHAICEIGCATGGHLYLTMHALPSVALIVGVDLRIWNRAFLRLLNRHDRKVTLVQGDSQDQSTIELVRSAAPLGGFDVLFIDGDHSYLAVSRDLRNFRHLVKDEGIIAFHDIVPDHKSRFGRDTGNWSGGVPLLWQELKVHFRTFEFVDSPDQDGYGIGALIYDPKASYWSSIQATAS